MYPIIVILLRTLYRRREVNRGHPVRHRTRRDHCTMYPRPDMQPVKTWAQLSLDVACADAMD